MGRGEGDEREREREIDYLSRSLYLQGKNYKKQTKKGKIATISQLCQGQWHFLFFLVYTYF